MPKPILPLPQAHRTDQKPDIYVIVLDALGRADTLQKHYGVSIDPFVEGLTGLGFKVFSDSRSNFPTTAYSLSSELNFSYLDQESIGLGADYPHSYPYPLVSLRDNNRLARFLKQQGYQVVNIYGGGEFDRFSVTDLHLGTEQRVNGCTYVFLKHTPLIIFPHRWLDVPQLDRRRQATLQALEELKQLPSKLHHPSLVVVHILCPHDPFFLDQQGGRPHADPAFDWEGKRDFSQGYNGQAQFLTAQVQTVVADLIKDSKQPPVILIQGDHGPAPLAADLPGQIAQRYPNFCALYLPGGDYSEFPEQITPVNYFRYILNRYFDTRLEILPNHSYHLGDARKPFVYTEISQHIGKAEAKTGGKK